MPASLTDRFGRTATDLRLSVTDVCNLRCTYCLPATGVSWLPRDTILDVDELARLARIGTQQLGISKIRLTGGEPLVRPDLVEIVRAIRVDSPEVEIALTSNGIGLADKADELKRAGVDRVNISLDTIHPETFAQITRRDQHSAVLDGIRAAGEAGLGPVKVNTVLVRGLNEHEAIDLVELCTQLGAELRFIEQMPIGATHDWVRDNLITASEIRDQISQRYQLRELPGRGTAPAARWEVLDGTTVLGVVGIIASVTEPFCGDCDRTRISADGQLRSCLFSREETDLRTPLRTGASDDVITQLWCATMASKPKGHGSDVGGFGPGFEQPPRPMNAIGG